MHKCPFVIKHSLTSKAVGNVINIPSIMVAKYEFSISYYTCTCKVGCNILGGCKLYIGSYDWSIRGTVNIKIKLSSNIMGVNFIVL